MNSREWDMLGFKKHRNPSGEVIRVKTYGRMLIAFDNHSTESIVAERKKLAELLGIYWKDLLADLTITVRIERYPRHRRFLKYIKSKVGGTT